jgi:4-hydroxy-tetrahydrodipicolinate reductase
MTRIAIVGATGRMGRCLIKSAMLNSQITLTTVIARPNSKEIGTDSGLLAGIEKTFITVTDSLESKLSDFDILIDFTNPEASIKFIEICQKENKKIVIGTTGFNQTQQDKISALSKEMAIVMSPNMSIGVNLTLKLLELTSQIIGEESDIEIIEAHHRHKIDAPSGTALRMGETIANSLNRNLNECAIYGREGLTGERNPKTIGFSTIRAGDIVGDHTVMFANEGERIEITHKASSRMTFANGAIRAATWLADKEKGLFTMRDVLNLA